MLFEAQATPFGVLRSTALLQQVPANIFQRLARHATLSAVAEGQYIYRSFDEAASLYFVAEGMVALGHRPAGGRTRIDDRVGPSEVFGILPCFTDGIHRNDAWAPRTRVSPRSATSTSRWQWHSRRNWQVA